MPDRPTAPEDLLCENSGLRERLAALESELRVKAQLFDASSAAQSAADAAGVINMVNDAFLALWGYESREQALGNSVGSFFVDPRDAVPVLEALGATGRWQGEFRARRRSGEEFISHGYAAALHDEEGKLVGYLSTNLDVTELRRNEAALARSKRELEIRNRIAEVFLTRQGDETFCGVLEVLLDAFRSPFGVFGFIDDAGALVVPSMTHHIWDQCRVPGRSTVFPRDTWGDSIWPTAIRRKEILHSNERSELTPPGHIRVDRNVAVPIIHGGRVVGLFQVANKASDYDGDDLALAQTIADAIAPILDARLSFERAQAGRERAEEELRRSNQELEQFAYVASHDLQEPLRMVSSYTQLLAQRYEGQLDQDAREFIGFAVDGANRMQRLIQDLLAYSRVTTRGRDPEPVDVHEVLGEAVRNLQAAIQESGALVTNDELPPVLGDRSQLVQLLQNLVGNGIKFRRPGVSPRVHVGAGPDAERPELAVFRVADNGIGIEARHLGRLFVIFQRLHGRDAYPGTGIGLALCKRIVERHGGWIRLESEVGKGTTVVFALPRAGGGKGVQE
jgi:PAS domain S-box-containing protein